MHTALIVAYRPAIAACPAVIAGRLRLLTLRTSTTPQTSAAHQRYRKIVIVVLATILCVIVINVGKDPPKESASASRDNQLKDLLPALGAATTLEKDVPELPAAPPPPPLPMQPPTSAAAGQDGDEQARLADTDVPKFAAITAGIEPDLPL
jgi:hypothetical protein